MGFGGIPSQLRAKLKAIAKREGYGPHGQLEYTDAMRIVDAERAVRTWMDRKDAEDMRRRLGTISMDSDEELRRRLDMVSKMEL